MAIPPSTLKVCPVMYSAAGSSARKRTIPATSSGFPSLLSGIIAETVFFRYKRNGENQEKNDSLENKTDKPKLTMYSSSSFATISVAI